MDKNELLRFIKRIILKADLRDAKERLRQLREILEPTADASMLELIDIAINDVPEVKKEAFSHALTEESMRIAHERAEKEREMEEMWRHYGRC